MVDSHGPGWIGGTPPVRPAAAIVLAAGDGTRMRSAVPKVLHPIAGRSLLGHAVHAVAALEPEHLVVVVGHGRHEVSDAVSGLGEELARPVLAAVQEKRLGTGHAVRCALDAVPTPLTGPVLVTYGDVPLLEPATLGALLAAHAASGAALTLLTSELADPSGYGRVLRESDGTVTRIVEEADASPEQRAVTEVNS
ncbi:MAG: bifunctional UDP-N-acetylglucosamine pyrophosphorylase / glucosamine-phosphate N-acetyltransferase, partial [Pseudonocardiales bacterium]|nr:bifunctional UDP-N-acetylglucosamine pyrophosphorylase / glucosamine-phosphate N-acetyltransferase [Pseudonocardiales bacterium]